MSEKEYVERILRYTENTIKYLVGLITALVTFLFFYGSGLSTFWLCTIIGFDVICILGLIVSVVTLRRYLRKLRRL